MHFSKIKFTQNTVQIRFNLCVQWRNPDLGHTCLQEQMTEITENTFVSPSRSSDKKGKEKKLKKNFNFG